MLMKFPMEELERINRTDLAQQNRTLPVSVTEVSHEASWGATILLKIESILARRPEYFLLTPSAASRVSKTLWQAVENYLNPKFSTDQPHEIAVPDERFAQLIENSVLNVQGTISPVFFAHASHNPDLGDSTIDLQIKDSPDQDPIHVLMTPPAAKQLSRALERTVGDYLDSA